LFNCIHRLLEEHLPSRETINILEVGCRSGDFCKTLFERGYQAFGIDLSHTSLQEARQQLPGCEFERASFYESFQNVFMRQFDAIVFLHAVEHLHSPQRFIHQVAGSLAPGGLFVISARFPGNVMSLPDALTGHADQTDFLQQIDGSTEDVFPTSLGQLLIDSGLEIVEFQGAGSLPSQWRAQLFVARNPV
jgi:2-polyprenyl-6-hydroxyphenyl methylase/3-demethylubiquinone-9 3-methyltransferase